jgi:hypothetical protein
MFHQLNFAFFPFQGDKDFAEFQFLKCGAVWSIPAKVLLRPAKLGTASAGPKENPSECRPCDKAQIGIAPSHFGAPRMETAV